MVKSSTLEHLISKFMENFSSLDINSIYQNKNFYFDAIKDIVQYLNIGKITLLYESIQSHANVLINKKPLYGNGLNVLYDTLKVCDDSQTVSFSYYQNDGNYIISFFKLSNTEAWNDIILDKIKIISNL